jgi:hypothetical protein
MHEGHVIDDEHAGFTDACEFLGNHLGRGDAIGAAIKCPGTAERAIPRAAAGELDRGTRVERANEIAPPPRQQIARGSDRIQGLDEFRWRSLPCRAHCARHLGQIASVLHGMQQQRHRDLTLALDDAVDCAGAVHQQVVGDKACAVPADEDEAAGQPRLDRLRGVDDLGDVG